jgi:Glycosyl transferase family 2
MADDASVDEPPRADGTAADRATEALDRAPQEQAGSPGRAEQWDTVLEAAQADAAFLRDELAARDAAIAEISLRTQSQAATIEELQTVLAERDLSLASTRRLAELRNAAAQRARTELIALQSARDAALVEAGERAAAAERRLQKALAERAQADGALARAQQSAALRGAEVAAAQAEVAALRAELRARDLIAETAGSATAEKRSAPASDPDPGHLAETTGPNRPEPGMPDVVGFPDEDGETRSSEADVLRARIQTLGLEPTSKCNLRRDAGAKRGARAAANPMPRVSIVYITYSQENFALDAVRSVLEQTYPLLDIVIVDDASPDRTADIISREVRHHRRRSDVRLFRNDRNLGPFDNVRKGLSLAVGDFIVMFSGDDVMLPTMVEEMAKVWLRDDVSLVTVNARYVDGGGNDLSRFFRDPTEPYDESFETLARHCGNAVSFGAAMGFERSLFEKFGWPPEYLDATDIMLPFYAYLTKGARFIPEPLLLYRVTGQNGSMTLQWESATNPVDKLLVWAEDRYLHLAHAFRMISELERLVQAEPARFAEIELRIRPLLDALVHERARQIVEARVQLHDMGVPAYLLRVDGDTSRPFAQIASKPLMLHETE